MSELSADMYSGTAPSSLRSGSGAGSVSGSLASGKAMSLGTSGGDLRGSGGSQAFVALLRDSATIQGLPPASSGGSAEEMSAVSGGGRRVQQQQADLSGCITALLPSVAADPTRAVPAYTSRGSAPPTQYVFLHGSTDPAAVHALLQKAEPGRQGELPCWRAAAEGVEGCVFALTGNQLRQLDRVFTDAAVRCAVHAEVAGCDAALACTTYVDAPAEPPARPPPHAAAAGAEEPPSVGRAAATEEERSQRARGSWAAAAADGAQLALKWGQSTPHAETRPPG
eukprot:COSAG04_NODE_789_length_10269_cov_17.022745_3_plen_282_part_00